MEMPHIESRCMLLEGAAKQSGLAVKQLLAQAPAKSRPNGSADQAFGFTEKKLDNKEHGTS